MINNGTVLNVRMYVVYIYVCTWYTYTYVRGIHIRMYVVYIYVCTWYTYTYVRGIYM